MDIQNNNTEYKSNPVGLLVLCLISTILLLYVSYLTVLPFMDFAGIIAFGALCASYSVLLRKGIFLTYVIPPAVSIAVITFIYTPTGIFSPDALMCYITLIFAIIVSAVANICAHKKSSYGTSFTAIAVSVAVYICTVLLFLVYNKYNSLSIEILKNALNDTAALIGSIFSQFLEELPPELSTEAAQYKELFEMYGKNMETRFKLTFPSMIAVTAMSIAAIVNIFSKPFAKFSGTENEYLEGRTLSFEMSGTSAICFEIVYFAYVIILLFVDNFMLQTAFVNLVSVLTFPFGYIGLRYIARKLKNTTGSKLAAVAITTISAVILSVLLGGSIFMLAALIGSSSINRKMLYNKSE